MNVSYVLRTLLGLVLVLKTAAATFTITSTNSAGPGTWREAITNANANPGPDLIAFNLPPATRSTFPTTALPAITDPVTIDGTTQPGFSGTPIVELAGNFAGVADGLRLTTTNCILRGLIINRFSGDNVELNSGGGHVIEGCYLGLNLTGTADQGAGQQGVRLENSTGNRVGGPTVAQRNVISGNNQNGILLNGAGSSNNVIQGNWIGVDVTGTNRIANSQHGISLANAPANQLGGSQAGEGNLISGNTTGILIDGTSAAGNQIAGNWIGLLSSGKVVDALGNTDDGIRLQNAPGTRVGGLTEGARNVIGGNTDGIELTGVGTTGTRIEGNWIGWDALGQPGTNRNHGIQIILNASGNFVGGTEPAAANRIAHSRNDGLFLTGGTNNLVLGNPIWGNGGLALDLGANGVLANDATDADTGPNLQQNYPVLRQVILHSNHTEISGDLRSTPLSEFTVEFFANTQADASGAGEGEEFLGRAQVVTDASGLASFTVELPVATERRFFSSTATDSTGNTSEFSLSIRALTAQTPQTFVVTTTADAGAGSLRQALLDATNSFNVADRIEFNIPGPGPHTISPLTALPPIITPLILDGYSQPGATANTLSNGFDAALKIVLDGNSAPNGTDGLSVQAARALVRGLVLTRFKGDGLELSAASRDSAVEGCVIGLALDSADQGQVGAGILINGGISNRVGGTQPDQRNVISGNNRSGVELSGATTAGNRVEGNWIGLSLNGRLDRGNTQAGILVNQAPGSRIGGSESGAGNRVAGNDGQGIDLTGASPGTRVLGNWIGLTSTDVALKNNANGIQVNGSFFQIGGPGLGEGNWIAFNGQRGINVFSGTNNVIRGNRLTQNEGFGLDLGSNNRTANDLGDADTGANQLQNFPTLGAAEIRSTETQVQGSLNSRPSQTYQLDFYSSVTADPLGHGEADQYLGAAEITTDVEGNGTFNVSLPIVAIGRFLTATATDPLGNTSEFATNVIASSTLPAQTFTVTNTQDTGPGSLRQALLEADAAVSGSPHRIGFAIPGDGPHVITPQSPLPVLANESVIVDGFSQPGSRTNSLANGNNAVLKIVLDGTDVLVDHGLRFIRPGNEVRGLSIVSFRQNGLLLGGSSNVVEGCWIGLLPDGTAKGNAGTGIALARTIFGTEGSPFNRIGGPNPGARNVIGGNGSYGISIPGGGTNNVIQGNYVGTDPSGTAARANRAGINLSGLGASNNLLGGSSPGAGNLVSGNLQQGLDFNGAGSGNQVLGNRLGTDVTGLLPLPNGDSGIQISGSGAQTLGGTAPGAGNRIAFNGASGIELAGGSNTRGVTIRGNSITQNGELGIDLGGFGNVEFNDPDDTDDGANGRQNFPLLTSGTVEATQTRVVGVLDSRPLQTYALDFYANVAANDSAHGEGDQYLGSHTVTTDAQGDASFDVTFPVAATGLFLTATATDPDGNTSEFSAAFKAQSTLGGQTFVVINTQDSGPGSLRQAILDSNANPTSGNRIEFQIPGAGPHVIQPATSLPVLIGPVTVDGFTQAGAQPNSLPDGNNAVLAVQLAGTSGTGFTLTDRDARVRGFSLTGFSTAVQLGGTNNQVAGCWLGLAPNGTNGPNNFGVVATSGKNGAIGGLQPADRTVISANQFTGISLSGTQDFVVAGNFIGTDATGLQSRPNDPNGVTVTGSGNTTIGGATLSARNLIAGHREVGLRVEDSSGVLVGNNWIGVAANGTSALGNGTGIEFRRVVGSEVRGNVISGNFASGLLMSGDPDGFNRVLGNRIGTDVSGSLPLPNFGPGISVSSTTDVGIGGLNAGEGNQIAHNDGPGIAVSLPARTVAIRANQIFNNAQLGIDRRFNGVSTNDVPDADGIPNYPTITAARVNVATVDLEGSIQAGPSQNLRLDFYASGSPDSSGFGEGEQYLGSTTVDTDATGFATYSLTLPTAATGRWITATSTDPSGDTSEFSAAFRADSSVATGEFLVTNTLDSGPGSLRQALLEANQVAGVSNNLIRFNLVGSGPHRITPLTPLPDLTESITLDGFSQPGTEPNTSERADEAVRLIELVGSSLPAGSAGLQLVAPGSVVRGLILREFADGLRLRGDSNRVEGCWISDNTSAGIRFLSGRQQHVGGPLPPHRNRFTGSSPHLFWEATAGPGTRVLGNLIGLEPDGSTPSPGSNSSLEVFTSQPLEIGGSQPGEGNRIAGRLRIYAGVGKSVRGNVFLNGGVGFPSDFFLPNDVGDVDSGPNGLQNFPELTSAQAVVGGTRIHGKLNSRPNAAFVLDLYSRSSNAPVDVRYLGSTTVTTDGSGNATWDVTLATAPMPGTVYGTATDTDGSTSSLGTAIPATTVVPPPTWIVTSTADSGTGSLRQAILDANTAFATGPGTIQFNLPGNVIHRIEPLSSLPTLTQGVILDGLSQPGASARTDPYRQNSDLRVQLHGGSAGPGADGLVLTGTGHVVRGLIFTGFRTGILVSNAPGSRIEHNWFGHDGESGAVRSASGVRPQAVGVDEFRGEIAIRVVNTSDLASIEGASTQLLENWVANMSVAGVSLDRSREVEIQGLLNGVDRNGDLFVPPTPIGLDMNAVERVQVSRNSQGPVYSQNTFVGSEVGIRIKNSRDVDISEAIVGGGFKSAWQLATTLGIHLENSSNVDLIGNDLSFNLSGIRVWGECFGGRIQGNRLNDTLEFGIRAEKLSSGLRLGGFGIEPVNYLGRGLGSSVQVNTPSMSFVEFNQFGTWGSGLFLGPDAVPAPTPEIVLLTDGLELRSKDGVPAGRFAVLTSDELLQMFLPKGNLFLPPFETVIKYPLASLLLQQAALSQFATVLLGAPTYSRMARQVEGEADLRIRFVPYSQSDTNFSRVRHVALIENRGPLNANYQARILGPINSRLRVIPPEYGYDALQFYISTPFQRAQFDPSEVELSGSLKAGAMVSVLLEVENAQGLPIQGEVNPIDRVDPDLQNNRSSTSPLVLPTSDPVALRIEPLPVEPVEVGETGILKFTVLNSGATAANGWRVYLPDTGTFQGTAEDAPTHTSTRDATGLWLTPKAGLGAGVSRNFELKFTAGLTAAYERQPLFLTDYTSDSSSPPWNHALFEIRDSTQLDRGDAPESYGTSAASGGPTHRAVPGFQLGLHVSADATAAPGVGADADADDGVFFPDPFVPGWPAMVEVLIPAQGYLDAWLDADRNGSFEHPAESLAQLLPMPPANGFSLPVQPGLNRFRLNLPPSLAIGTTYLRARFSPLGQLGPDGFGGTGEVEDYRVEVYSAPPDFGDAPDFLANPGYPTLAVHDGASHLWSPTGPKLGTRWDSEPSPQPDGSALGDDQANELGENSDEDGVALVGLMVPGQSANIRVTTTLAPGTTAKVDGWIDFNADFDWDDAGEQVAISRTVNPGANLISIPIPANAAIGNTFARIRLSTAGGLTPRGPAPDGEVEDYQVTITAPQDCRFTSFEVVPTGLRIQWNGNAVLEGSPSLNGIWIPVPGQIPGNTIVPFSSDQRFFRIQCP
ncbi:MAG: right-handed parallel beta-helix repeat-containing protein [Verrucomicrobia bacterium]|nr:right-handed parallel beta-helix repeat-containing protein [Verrucomicrobiota bacterium]